MGGQTGGEMNGELKEPIRAERRGGPISEGGETRCHCATVDSRGGSIVTLTRIVERVNSNTVTPSPYSIW